jgi:hypothetical protein
LGFGRPATEAVLGEVLDLAIPVRLDTGEDLQDNCVTAEVYFGENKQMQGTVQVRVEGAGMASGNQRTVRVNTTRRVDEPFVTLYLAAGCTSTISRKFVLFADPPTVVAPAPAPAGRTPAASGGRPAAGPAADAARASAQGAASLPLPETGSPAGPAAAAGTPAPRAARNPRPAPSSSSTAAPAARVAPAAGVEATSAAPAVAPSLRVTPAPPRAAAPAAAADRPRLMLDPAEAELLINPELRMAAGLEQAPSADAPVPEDLRARRAAAAAMWRALNATPEELARDKLRLQELEARLAALRQPGAASAADAGPALPGAAGAPSVLVYVLAGLSAALAAALAAVLVRRRRDPRDSQWWREEAQAAAAAASGALAAAAQPAPAEPLPPSAEPATPARRPAELPQAPAAVTPSQSPRAVWPSSRAAASASPAAAATPAAVEPATPFLPAASPAGAAAPAPAPTAAPAAAPAAELSLPGGLFGTRTAEAPRAVSVEELIDLEQQAEFFLVLGQDQAAIDLLESHVAGPAGGSPLPYLKLLELYRRRDDRQAYENLRERFNGRFNAYAPHWDADLQSGHSLSDYPGVIERLQALWTTPERAMEVLQASLLRSDPQADTFDLPAYRELLFLYSVARDLAEREAGQPPVDLLLPFGDEPAAVERLTATRPVKTHPAAQPPLVVDFTLDDIEPPADPVRPITPITPPGGSSGATPLGALPSGATSADELPSGATPPGGTVAPDTGPIEFEHIEIPKKPG